MPHFRYQHGFDTVSIITGPSHMLLGIRFSEEPAVTMELIRRPHVGGCGHGILDENRIRESILAGIAAANAKTGAKLTVGQAFNIENDTPRYDLFEHCAFLLASKGSKPAE